MNHPIEERRQAKAQFERQLYWLLTVQCKPLLERGLPYATNPDEVEQTQCNSMT